MKTLVCVTVSTKIPCNQSLCFHTGSSRFQSGADDSRTRRGLAVIVWAAYELRLMASISMSSRRDCCS